MDCMSSGRMRIGKRAPSRTMALIIDPTTSRLASESPNWYGCVCCNSTAPSPRSVRRGARCAPLQVAEDPLEQLPWNSRKACGVS